MVELRISGDGSHTLYLRDMDEHYHSIHGALAESLHVFIHHGLQSLSLPEIRLFEMGFGTGLNALLSWMEAEKTACRLIYHSIEKHPLPASITDALNYPQLLGPGSREKYRLLHSCTWDREVILSPHLHLTKIRGDLGTFIPDSFYHLIYFDAFAPDKQPGLWHKEVFVKMYDMLHPGGVLTTYAAKGELKRTLRSTGFEVQALPGPPGKREMIRAVKLPS